MGLSESVLAVSKPARAGMFRFERRLAGAICFRGEASEGGQSPPPSYLNAGMTSREKRVSCSIMTSLGVPMAQPIMTWSSPGYRCSISFR